MKLFIREWEDTFLNNKKDYTDNMEKVESKFHCDIYCGQTSKLECIYYQRKVCLICLTFVGVLKVKNLILKIK